MREFDKILRGLDREALNALAAGLLERMGGAAENAGQSPSHGVDRDSPLYTMGPLNGGFTAEENEEAGRSGARALQEAFEADSARRVVAPYGWNEEIPPAAEAASPLYKGGEELRRDRTPYAWEEEETSHPSPAATPSPQGEGLKSAAEPFLISEDDERARMRSVSDFFRRDGRRYDGGFVRY